MGRTTCKYTCTVALIDLVVTTAYLSRDDAEGVRQASDVESGEEGCVKLSPTPHARVLMCKKHDELLMTEGRRTIWTARWTSTRT
jgi:hypothetical protein